ncbi:MAG: putative outer membrane protein [Acidobacteria bacterium]|nr:putative outer membrane protein [Acidobacteriota bacterium]
MCILWRVRYPIAFVLLAGTAAGACRSAALAPPTAARAPIVQPGAPGQPSQVIAPAQASDLSKVQYTGGDIKFMQGMIGHHAQAVEMVALVPGRTASDEVRKLAMRIDVSQKDEMEMMREWLQARGQPIPDPRAHHMMGATLMPGMLTAEEMARLAAATGAEFDRLFLEGMIKHHSGAITMVHELFATDGAGQTPEIFSYASDVDADQRMEIDRMGSMLKELQK